MSRDAAGLKKLFKQFSFPGGIGATAPGDTWLDPRGRGAGVPLSRLRGRVRQSGPDRRVRGRRRGGRDRAAGHELALEQVPQSGPRRGGPADPASQRVQDRQPCFLARIPHPELQQALRGVRLYPALRRRGPTGLVHRDGCGTRRVRGRNQLHPGRGPVRRHSKATGLADDRPSHAQGVDLPAAKSTAEWSRGTWRSHQVPLVDMESEEHLRVLERWMKSYRPEELFDQAGTVPPGAVRSGSDRVPADGG